MSLEINPGDRICLVGEGETTILYLILRFYDPDFGQILIDGVDLKLLDIKQLRAKMGLALLPYE